MCRPARAGHPTPSTGGPAWSAATTRSHYTRGMDAAVALVRTYLHLNGFFTVSELPVIRRNRDGSFHQVTDIDILALRFPRAGHIVSRGRPGADDDLTFAHDPGLDVSPNRMDLIIGEVKQGRPRLNPALREREALTTALVRTGCCPPAELSRVIENLRRSGEAHLSAEAAGVASRIRLIAFGDGEGNALDPGTRVIPLKQAARFVGDHLRHYRAILHPVHLSDPVLGLLHLIEKLR